MKKIMLVVLMVGLGACGKSAHMSYLCGTPAGVLDTDQAPNAKIKIKDGIVTIDTDTLTLQVSQSNCLGVIRK